MKGCLWTITAQLVYQAQQLEHLMELKIVAEMQSVH